MKLLGLPQQSASWFAYYLIVRNSLLYNGAKLSPKVEKFYLNQAVIYKNLA